MPLLKRYSVLAAKIETTSGTAESLSNSDGAFNVYDMTFQHVTTTDERRGQGAFSPLAQVPGLRLGRFTFKSDLQCDGSGGVPGWASTFLPACGWVNATGTYSPKTEAPGSNVKTLTIGGYVNGRKQVIRGAAGTFKINLPTGKHATIEWDFLGAYVAKSDASVLTPTYPTIIPMRAVAETLTWGSITPIVESVVIDAGNEVIAREDATQSDASGIASAIITGRRPVITLNPEAALVASATYWADFYAMTERAFTYEIDNGTDRFVIAAPAAQVQQVAEGERNDLLTDEIVLQCNRSAAAGNDELTLQFAATD